MCDQSVVIQTFVSLELSLGVIVNRGNIVLCVHVVKGCVCVIKTLDARVAQEQPVGIRQNSPRFGGTAVNAVMMNTSTLAKWEFTFFPLYSKDWGGGIKQ